MDKPFHMCSSCGHVWERRDDFLNDRTLKVVGYHADLENLPQSLYNFTHQRKDCSSTFSVPAVSFLDLYAQQIYAEPLMPTNDCPGYCRDDNNLEHCDLQCDCAMVREVLGLVKERLEKAASQAQKFDQSIPCV